MIDFKEIPQANTGHGYQDTFELFARDFFNLLGYTVLNDPARGADGGIDFKICKSRTNASGKKFISNYLVSCKHYAHSGGSISPSIEQNIVDRVISNECDGFIGFYSTISSSSLESSLKRSSGLIEFELFDHRKIEGHIIGDLHFENLFQRYFPISYVNWKSLSNIYEPIKLLNFYIDKQFHDYLNIFDQIFGPMDYAIKLIRNIGSIEECLDKNNIAIIEEPELLNYLMGNKKFEYLEGSEYKIEDIWDVNLPNEIYYKYGVKPINKARRILYSPMGSFVLYPNHIIVDANYLEGLKEMYKDLRNIIN